MTGFILRRRDLSIERQVEILAYSDCPVDTVKLSDKGTVSVKGRIPIESVCGYLLIDDLVFYIASVGYLRETDCTELGVKFALCTLEMQQYIKPTGSSVKAFAEFTRMVTDATNHIITSWMGVNLPSPTNTFVDPVFRMSYLDINTYAAPAGERAWAQILYVLNSESVNAVNLVGFEGCGKNGFYSLADVMTLIRNQMYWTSGSTISSFQTGDIEPKIVNGELFLGFIQKGHHNDETAVNVLLSGENLLISEDYEEGDYFSQVTLTSGSSRFHFARWKDENGLIHPRLVNNNYTLPLESSGYTVISGDSSHVRLPYGKWAFDSTIPDAELRRTYVYENYWADSQEQYRIVFATPERLFVGQYLNLIFPEGDMRRVTVDKVTVSSEYPGRFVVSCGGLAVSLTEKLRGNGVL